MSVWVVGALHHDVVVRAPRLPRLDETLPGSGVAYLLGGKGGNQAVAAARMGAGVAMQGAVGTDAAGDTLLADLARAGVNTDRIVRIPGATGMSVAILDADGAYGAVIVSAANLSVQGDGPPPPGARILLLQNEIPEPANLATARAARAAGLKVILNAAPARPADPALMALVELLVVNRVEAAMLSGQPEDAPDRAARALQAQGPATVIVTLGGDGLICQPRDGTGWSEPAFPAQVHSTHGAGDAFLGALAAALVAGDPLPAACRFAQAAAALHVAATPAERATLRESDVRALIAPPRP